MTIGCNRLETNKLWVQPLFRWLLGMRRPGPKRSARKCFVRRERCRCVRSTPIETVSDIHDGGLTEQMGPSPATLPCIDDLGRAP